MPAMIAAIPPVDTVAAIPKSLSTAVANPTSVAIPVNNPDTVATTPIMAALTNPKLVAIELIILIVAFAATITSKPSPANFINSILSRTAAITPLTFNQPLYTLVEISLLCSLR